MLPVLGGSQSVFWFPKRTEERGESEKGFIFWILSGEMFSHILRAAKLECPIGFCPNKIRKVIGKPRSSFLRVRKSAA